MRAIIKSGRSLRADGISAKYQPGQALKVAVVVSKKVAPGAIERNRLRRLVYRSLPPSLPLVHVVLFVQSAALNSAQVATLCSQLS